MFTAVCKSHGGQAISGLREKSGRVVGNDSVAAATPESACGRETRRQIALSSLDDSGGLARFDCIALITSPLSSLETTESDFSRSRERDRRVRSLRALYGKNCEEA